MQDTTLPNAYNSPTFGRLDWDATLKKIVWFLGRDVSASYEIIIGTDSQGQNGDVDFVSAIIVHKKGRGGIYFWGKHEVKHLNSLKQRIWQEAIISLSLAEKLVADFADMSLFDTSTELSAGYSLVDFNRAGVPLMELVTKPVIKSADEALEFARELQLLLRYLGISDADMDKGQMRVEVNISISTGKKLGTKVEVKNLNSFRAVERAKQHPYKMWVVRENRCLPLFPLWDVRVQQIQSMPEVYWQNASLEMAWTRVLWGGTITGYTIAPFFTEGLEGFDVNTIEDWHEAERIVASGKVEVPK